MPNQYTPEFEEFYHVYGKKDRKGFAFAAYNRAMRETDHETLVALASEYSSRFENNRKFQKLPASWIKGKPWNGRKPKPSWGKRGYLQRCEQYGLEPKIVPFNVRKLIEKHGDKCYYCGEDWEHVEHVIPVAAGGEHSLDNCVPSCADCNYKKLEEVDKALISEFRQSVPIIDSDRQKPI